MPTISRFGLSVNVDKVECLDFIDRWFDLLSRMGVDSSTGNLEVKDTVTSAGDLVSSAGWLAHYITNYIPKDGEEVLLEVIGDCPPEDMGIYFKVFEAVEGRLHTPTPYMAFPHRQTISKSIAFLEKCEYPQVLKEKREVIEVPSPQKVIYSDPSDDQATTIYETSDKSIVMKEFPATTFGFTRGLIEWSVNQEVSGDNLMKYIAYKAVNDTFRIFLPRMVGDLEKGVFSSKEVLEVLPQCHAALTQLHTCGFIHNDVKPANFLFSLEDGKVVVKLIDFELACRTSERSRRSAHPEQFRRPVRKGCPTQEDDLYALTCVCVWLSTAQVLRSDRESRDKFFTEDFRKFLLRTHRVKNPQNLDVPSLLNYVFIKRSPFVKEWLKEVLRETPFENIVTIS